MSLGDTAIFESTQGRSFIVRCTFNQQAKEVGYGARDAVEVATSGQWAASPKVFLGYLRVFSGERVQSDRSTGHEKSGSFLR
ncbi:hypothetical protein PM082_013330 [Marasmius tenuissimus]|nr:hypothetical protein PM082_013330 [Marasmius tenuissimus]